MDMTVRVYGSVPNLPTLEEEMRRLFGRPVYFQVGNPGDDQRSEDVWKSELIVCGFAPAAPSGQEEELFQFLGRVVSEYGAWGYLPQLIIGLPNDANRREQLYRLGASCYRPATDPPRELAQKAYNTWRATWWQTEYQSEIPVLVVSRAGVIMRANPCAVRHFGPGSLVGQNYMQAVEGQPSPGRLPDDHPIRLTFQGPDPQQRRWGKTLCVERQFARRNAPVRFFLMCSPLVIPSGSLRAARVALLDMSRWSRIIEASDAFARATSSQELYQLIVEYGQRLGFRRLRLYELVDADQRLYGRAAVGFRVRARHDAFVNGFSIPADGDQPTRITLRDKKHPVLYILGTGQDTESTVYLTEPHPYVEELEFQEVSRWIEAPIFLPPTPQGDPAQAWGKLSLDQGPEPGQPDVRDVGDVAVFCSTVGLALVMVQRLEQEARQRERLHHFSAELVREIKPDERILDPFVKHSLRLALEVTGGDIALYRRYDRQLPQALRLIGKAEFRDAAMGDALDIPPELPEGYVLSGYFRHFPSRENPTPAKQTYVVSDPEGGMARYLREHGRSLTERQRRYVKSIKSEVHIPVFRGEDQVIGVIVVIGRKPNAFPEVLCGKVGQCVDTISLGIEAARRHDDWLLMDQALRRAISLMPHLADVPRGNDEAFFAALATLLSAGQGLCWNRVFIFSCHVDGAPPRVAELVYALGGLTTKEGIERHRRLQDRLLTDPRYRDLKSLVGARIENPSPHWEGEGRFLTDDLYNLCIEGAKEHGPIRVGYDDRYHETEREAKPRPSEAGEIEKTHPVAELLRLGQQELSAEYDPLTIPVPSPSPGDPPRNGWLIAMNERHPGMFDASKRLFAFLLRGTADDIREPLGAVLVSMQSSYEVDEQDMVAATRILLRFASNLLAERLRRRLYYGNINTLPARCHGTTLAADWAGIEYKLRPITEALDSMMARDSEMEAQLLPIARKLIPELIGEGSDPKKWAKDFVTAVKAFNSRIKQKEAGDLDGIEDLGALLAELREHYQQEKEKYKEVVVAIPRAAGVEGLRVPCDRQVLRGAIAALIDNSRAEGHRRGKRLNVRLEAEVVETGCPAMPQLVELRYADDGEGIPEEHRTRIMLDGYTLAEPPTGKGRGLSLISRQLLEYHGHIECVAPPEKQQGARFVIRLGIPAPPEPAKRGAPHAAPASR